MSSFIEYEVDLRTSLAKQLWNGRHKTADKTFIPGVLEFNLRVAQLAQSTLSSDRDQLAELQSQIEECRAAVLAWQCDLQALTKTLLPNNARSIGLGLKPETKTVRFSQECSRQLALLIAQFDDISCQAIVAERMRKDLGLAPEQRPTEPTKRFSKSIKAIIYAPRIPAA